MAAPTIVSRSYDYATGHLTLVWSEAVNVDPTDSFLYTFSELYGATSSVSYSNLVSGDGTNTTVFLSPPGAGTVTTGWEGRQNDLEASFVTAVSDGTPNASQGFVAITSWDATTVALTANAASDPSSGTVALTASDRIRVRKITPTASGTYRITQSTTNVTIRVYLTDGTLVATGSSAASVTFTAASGTSYLIHARKASSGTNNYSATYGFDAPAAVTTPSPADGATGVSLTATLSWAAALGATGYNVLLDAGTNPPVTVVSTNQAGLTYTPSGLTPNTLYYWRVQSVGPGGTTNGPVWAFTTELAPDGSSASVVVFIFML